MAGQVPAVIAESETAPERDMAVDDGELLMMAALVDVAAVEAEA